MRLRGEVARDGEGDRKNEESGKHRGGEIEQGSAAHGEQGVGGERREEGDEERIEVPGEKRVAMEQRQECASSSAAGAEETGELVDGAGRKE